MIYTKTSFSWFVSEITRAHKNHTQLRRELEWLVSSFPDREEGKKFHDHPFSSLSRDHIHGSFSLAFCFQLLVRFLPHPSTHIPCYQTATIKWKLTVEKKRYLIASFLGGASFSSLVLLIQSDMSIVIQCINEKMYKDSFSEKATTFFFFRIQEGNSK